MLAEQHSLLHDVITGRLSESVAELSKEVTGTELDQGRQVRQADSRGQIGFDVGSNERCLPGRRKPLRRQASTRQRPMTLASSHRFSILPALSCLAAADSPYVEVLRRVRLKCSYVPGINRYPCVRNGPEYQRSG